MNIPDEYWTTEVPDGVSICAIKWRSGAVEVVSIHAARVFAREPDAMGARFCRLAPAAEVERVRSESDWRLERYHEAQKLSDMKGVEINRLKAENEKLRGWVRDAYEEGRDHQSAAQAGDDATFENSMAKVRLERRSE